jgi:hypothetical protein
VTEDAVVNQVVDSSSVQYAVIAGLSTETGPERLVIAYPNEESLRDLIAAPSIVALGFSSREDAVAGGSACATTSVAYQRMPEAIASGEMETNQQELNWAKRGGETGSTLRRLARLFAISYRDVATTAIVIFSSRSAISSLIRTALGSSV